MDSVLRLGQEDERIFDAFEQAIRGRPWYSVAVMDTFASLDGSTAAMFHWDDLDPAPLIPIDLQGMSPDLVPRSSSPGFNDISIFALMVHAMECRKKILSMLDSTEDRWTSNVQLVLTFGRAIEQAYCNLEEDAQPLEKLASDLARRPLSSYTSKTALKAPFQSRSSIRRL